MAFDRKAYAHEHYVRNRERYAEQTRARRAGMGEAFLARQRGYQMKFRHGQYIGEDYAAMWDAQDGCCYLCGQDLTGAKVHVDHDHSCCPPGKSCRACRRGLTCTVCNQAVGLAGDDPDRLRKIADNLEAAQLAVRNRMAAASCQLELAGSQE